MVKKEFGTMQLMSVKAVVDYFTTKADRGTAEDIGVSGSFMSSLCRRGYAKVVDVKSGFVCIDEYTQTYRKVDVNVYALAVRPSVLAMAYKESRERMSEVQKTRAEALIDKAQEKLEHAKLLLQNI